MLRKNVTIQSTYIFIITDITDLFYEWRYKYQQNTAIVIQRTWILSKKPYFQEMNSIDYIYDASQRLWVPTLLEVFAFRSPLSHFNFNFNLSLRPSTMLGIRSSSGVESPQCSFIMYKFQIYIFTSRKWKQLTNASITITRLSMQRVSRPQDG